jgi:hypothetical protein
MERHKTGFPVCQLFQGTVLVALGLVTLYDNVARVVASLSCVASAHGAGLAPTINLAARLGHEYVTQYHQFMRGLSQHTCLLSWPLLLVIAGTFWSRDTDPAKLQPTSHKRISDVSI